ncbi:MAG: hypothetical protein EOO05_08280 [Chitinophagaceae bacterium]|nr:MAG: hypothetical protein EOO05_08280 [Chitinophagaceae bacterium]
MSKIFTERTLVVFLFIAALVVFSFASEDAHSLDVRNAKASGVRYSPTEPQVVDNNSNSAAAARD